MLALLPGLPASAPVFDRYAAQAQKLDDGKAWEQGYHMLISNQLVEYECPLVLGALVQSLVSHMVSQFPLTSSLVPRPTHFRRLQRKFRTTSDKCTKPGGTDCVVGH